jgi:hypothetical protein
MSAGTNARLAGVSMSCGATAFTRIRASRRVLLAGCRGASAGSACLTPQCASRRSAPASSVPSAVSW